VGVRLDELVRFTGVLEKTTRPSLRDSLAGKTIFGGAYADDLTLMAKNRAGLQELADTCSSWFEALDITLNPLKSVHLSSYNPATRRPTVGRPHPAEERRQDG
jgi:hypothetical protein